MTHRRRPSLVALIAACTLSLLVAACGSSSNTSTVSPSAAGSKQQMLVSFAECMRSHGVSDFPDPGSAGFKSELAPNASHTPAFRSALTVCGHLLPSAPPEVHTPVQIAAFVAFARCIRGHGFPRFPDPTNSGHLTHQMLASAGINISQPAVVRAADACVSVTHGLITKAAVANFVAGR
ncbi:MAG: hypothetical protein ACYCXW_16975 [Solirubrobacteraceae bacterium]